nr:tyrosine-type recombinase/integrase [uncultured Kingella sp.]
MGVIIKRINPSGKTVYRAQIRINRASYPKYSESKTFSRHALAAAWLKKREAELELNPELLYYGGKKHTVPTLAEAIQRYLDEPAAAEFARSKTANLKFLLNYPIAKVRIDKIRRIDISNHVMQRRNGADGVLPVKGTTVNNDLQYIRGLIKHAHFVWGMDVSWAEIDLAIEGARRARLVGRSQERMRLPTTDELQRLTTHFYTQWHLRPNSTKLPMHLIIWFAVYSCRRQEEITRLQWADYNQDTQEWLARDLKNPSGSKGNHSAFIVLEHTREVIQAFRRPEIQNRLKWQGMQPETYLIGGESRSISAAFTRACKLLQIDDLHFHDLRHEGATRLAEDGLTVPQMQQITLHSNWQTLQRYVNLAARIRPNRLDFAKALAEAEKQWRK